MTTQAPTLAQKLANNIADGKPVLEYRAPALLAIRRRQAVERFFEDAKEHFTYIIEKGAVPCPFVLGTATFWTGTEMAGIALEYHGWKDAEPPANNAFSRYWFAFKNWAAEQGLEAFWQDEHDGVGIHSWKTLGIRPLPAVRPDQTRRISCTLDLPLDVLERYGSAQAYLSNLERRARAND